MTGTKPWRDDRDKTINHITSEYSKLVQKSKNNWVGKVIQM